MIPTRFYHLSRAPIGIGEDVEPRFIRGHEDLYGILCSALKEDRMVIKSLMLTDMFLAVTGGGHRRLPIVLKETVLELVRTSEFPSKPSRLSAVFLCPDKTTAMKFNARMDGLYSNLYLCEVYGGNSTSADISFDHVADPLEPIVRQIDFLQTQAGNYWSGTMSDDPVVEIVTTGKVTVIAEDAV